MKIAVYDCALEMPIQGSGGLCRISTVLESEPKSEEGPKLAHQPTSREALQIETGFVSSTHPKTAAEFICQEAHPQVLP